MQRRELSVTEFVNQISDEQLLEIQADLAQLFDPVPDFQHIGHNIDGFAHQDFLKMLESANDSEGRVLRQQLLRQQVRNEDIENSFTNYENFLRGKNLLGGRRLPNETKIVCFDLGGNRRVKLQGRADICIEGDRNVVIQIRYDNRPQIRHFCETFVYTLLENIQGCGPLDLMRTCYRREYFMFNPFTNQAYRLLYNPQQMQRVFEIMIESNEISVTNS